MTAWLLGNYPDRWRAGVVYLGLGEKDMALEWLEKSYADRDPQCWPLKVEPFYDSLRTEPRFQALLKKVFPDP